MSTLADDVTKPSGTENSVSSASANGNRSVFPDEGEHLAASANGEEPATLTDGGKQNQLPNASGSTMSPAGVAGKYQDCSELLSQAVRDAQLLAIYMSRNGMHVRRDGQTVTPEVLQGITDAREHFENRTLTGNAAAAFLKNHRELAAAAFPVTVKPARFHC
jgi:hypothetical protein